MTTALEVVRQWRQAMADQDFAQMAAVVDLPGYTEICLGLTGWTTGYEVAWRNFVKNMVEPWEDMQRSDVQVLEGEDGVTIRSRIEATQRGEFLGIPPTGRRVAFDNVAIISVKDGRVVGQWSQPDLWGIYQQLTAAPDAA